MTRKIGQLVPGAKIAEKEGARTKPTVNTAIYYDTEDYLLLGTGALLRTSCNIITHAFCAFKESRKNGVRKDHRHVFQGKEKLIIQKQPNSPEAKAIVKKLLEKGSDTSPGKYLYQQYHISADELFPSLRLDNSRYSFYVWLDKKDALRCSYDHAEVQDLRNPKKRKGEFFEVELSIYPRLEPSTANDKRLSQLIKLLSNDIRKSLSVKETSKIKYQRGAKILGIG